MGYKKIHNTTIVPRKYEKHPQLGEWIHTQRNSHKNGNMKPNRLALLNSIDFVWKASDERWMEMFQKLVEYMKIHKSTIVPRRYKEDPRLGEWVIHQRCLHNKGDMQPNRITLLNSIDFVWIR